MSVPVLPHIPHHADGAILLISFEDADIVDEFTKSLPESQVDCLTKADLGGVALGAILRRIRRKRYNLLVLSNRNATVLRTARSLRLLALGARARRVAFVDLDGSVTATSRLGLAVRLFPSLLAVLLRGLILLARAWFSVFWWRSRLGERQWPAMGGLPEGSRMLIAYLRTDLSGGVKVGGSVSHMMGFIDAARALGYRFFLVADAEIQGSCTRGIPMHIIEPSNRLGIFDEWQMIDYHYRVVRRGAEIINASRPDLIYHRHSIFSFASVVLGRRLKLPVVLEVNASEVWVKSHWSRLVFGRLARAFEGIAFRGADLIAVVSERVRDEIVSLGADPSKIIVNPNGVDPERFRADLDGSRVRQTLPLASPDGIVVGFVGTFTRWHGVETLLDAVKLVHAERKPIHFLLIGDGNLKPNLEADVRDHGLEGEVTFTGLILHAETPAYLSACDILVSPHLGFEDGTPFFGSPTKLFEYMAMGKAIIASNLEQIGAIIRDGENGLLMEPGDSAGLAAKILKLAGDTDLRRRLGAQARKDVVARYTWTMNVERVLRRIEEGRS